MTTEQAIKILNGAIKKPNTIDGYLGQALTMAINALKNQPEIIRCKDCRYWARNTQFCGVFSSLNIAQRMPEDGFCSYGGLRGDSDG